MMKFILLAQCFLLTLSSSLLMAMEKEEKKQRIEFRENSYFQTPLGNFNIPALFKFLNSLETEEEIIKYAHQILQDKNMMDYILSQIFQDMLEGIYDREEQFRLFVERAHKIQTQDFIYLSLVLNRYSHELPHLSCLMSRDLKKGVFLPMVVYLKQLYLDRIYEKAKKDKRLAIINFYRRIGYVSKQDYLKIIRKIQNK